MIDFMLCIFYYLQFFKSALSEAPQLAGEGGRDKFWKKISNKKHL